MNLQIPSVAQLLRGIVEAIVDHRVDYLAAYPSTILAQASDGTLELRPDSTKIPEMVGIPIRYGIPGVRAKVKAGTRALLAFESGSPAAPYAIVHDQGAVLELELLGDLVKLAGGSRSVARKGDAVHVVIGAVAAKAIVTLGLTPAIPPVPVGVVGFIADGAPKVKA